MALRVYEADGAATRPTPALVWAHGGGFVNGSLDMPEADWVARAFAAGGVTVVSVDYRLVADGVNVFPAASDDVLEAWAWTLAHAESLGIDPSKVVIGGASAGANLAAGAVLRMLAGSDASDDSDASGAAPLPAGVFLAYPTLLAVQPAPDPALRAALDADPEADRFDPASVRGMYETYLGGPVDDAPVAAVPGRATAAELAGFPPTVIVNGDVDELRVSGEAFAVALGAAGVSVELALEPGTHHGHLNRPEEPAATATVERVVAWLGERFGLRGLGTRPPSSGATRPAGAGAARPARLSEPSVS